MSNFGKEEEKAQDIKESEQNVNEGSDGEIKCKIISQTQHEFSSKIRCIATRCFCLIFASYESLKNWNLTKFKSISKSLCKGELFGEKCDL